MNSNSFFEITNLSRNFGGIKAVDDVSFTIQEGEVLGLIGPNGAGKTTLFNLITGMDRASLGKIYFKGELINKVAPHKIGRLGIMRTFQNIRLFKGLTVLENVMIGGHYKSSAQSLKKYRFLNAMHSLLRKKSVEQKLVEDSMHWVKFFQLDGFARDLAKNLSYGKQRELEIARALAAGPELLFLDEPAAGMNPNETEILMDNIARITKLGITVVLIEHDMRLVMKACSRIIVLDQGQKIAEGNPEEVKSNRLVIEAYLGTEA